MLDLGDEVGQMFLRSANRDLLRALQQFYRLAKQYQQQRGREDHEGRDVKEADLEKPATEEQLNYLKRLVGADQYRAMNLDNLNRGEASTLIGDLKQRNNFLFRSDDRAIDSFTRFLGEHNIAYRVPEGVAGAVIISTPSLDNLVKDIEEWQKAADVQLLDLKLDEPNMGLNPQQIQNLNRVQPEQAVEEPKVADGSMDMDGRTPDINQGIESHDGMDIDARTLVVESTGFQWKDDLAERAAEARELANSHDELVARCAERGITLDRAADGQYLYRDSQSPWHNLRGDSLGERFTRESFPQSSLAERAKTVSQVVDSVNAERDMPFVDRPEQSR